MSFVIGRGVEGWGGVQQNYPGASQAAECGDQTGLT